MTARAVVIENLTHLALGEQITGAFHQTQHRIDAQVAEGQVDEGFCKGVCVDWARRVIGGGGGGKSAFSTNAERKSAQTFRQGNAQLRIEARDDTYNGIIAVRNKLVIESNPQLNQQTIQITPELYTSLRTYFNINAEPGHRYAKTRVQNWLSQLAQMAEQRNHSTTVGWAAFAGVMDAMHLENREDQGRAESNRRFSSIRIVESSERIHFPNIHNGIEGLIMSAAFVAGTVMILGFGLTDNGNPTGHAVAAHRTNTGYQFLDPNYGIFPCNLDGLRSMLRYLFGTEPGVPIYGEPPDTVTGGIEHILFAHV